MTIFQKAKDTKKCCVGLEKYMKNNINCKYKTVHIGENG